MQIYGQNPRTRERRQDDIFCFVLSVSYEGNWAVAGEISGSQGGLMTQQGAQRQLMFILCDTPLLEVSGGESAPIERHLMVVQVKAPWVWTWPLLVMTDVMSGAPGSTYSQGQSSSGAWLTRTDLAENHFPLSRLSKQARSDVRGRTAFTSTAL